VTEPEEDFATLFEASQKTTKLQPGRPVEGTIVKIGDDIAFVDVGAKGEATIPLDELRNEDHALEFGVGDRIQATLVATSGGLTLSRKLQRGAASASQVESAFHAGLPVEGKVEKIVKGGYEVRIARLRAFCPQSQIDIVRHTDPAVHEGRVYTFKIVEFAGGGQKFVVSRRALQEAEQEVRAAEVRRSLTVGAVMKGQVVSVRDFGAFVDLGGGVQGLLHVSEMGWARGANATDVVSPGQELTVKVVRIDEATGQIALSIKQLSADPWTMVGGSYEVGQVKQGRVTRVADFGAFVEFEPGIEGLAHASTFAPTGQPGGWARTVKPGMTGAFEILTVDTEKKRIGVALVDEASSRATTAAPARSAIVPGARLTGKVERHEPFGMFVFLAPGVTGLVPSSETGLARDTDAKKAFPPGMNVEVIVLEVDPAGRRIRLSLKAIEAAEEAAEVRDYAAREQTTTQGGSFGSLADKLRGALSKK
jgi:small subunit ribosomal protein S1